jgi:hypothetical protein
LPRDLFASRRRRRRQVSRTFPQSIRRLAQRRLHEIVRTSNDEAITEMPMKVEEILKLARRLPPDQQRELARALASPGPRVDLPITQFPSGPAPHSPAWVKSEQGHAVLATDAAPAEASLPAGPAALAGIWAGRDDLP